MTLVRRLVLCLALVSFAACSSGGGGNNPKPVTTFGHLRVINSILDSPALSVQIGAAAQGIVSYSQASRLMTLGTGDYQLNVQYTTPGGTVQKVVDSRALTIDVDREATILLFGTLGSVSVVALDDPDPAVAAGSTEVRFLQGANGAGSMDFYLTDAGVDIATVAPNATVNASAASDLATVPSGPNNRLRVTAAGSKTVLFDSGPFTLDDKARRVFLLSDYFGPGGAAVRAVQIDDSSASTFLAEDLPAAVAVANEVVDLAGLDGYLHGVAGSPDFANVVLDSTSASQTVPAGPVDVALTTAGDPSHAVHDASFMIGTGETQTVVVAGVDATGHVSSRAVPALVRPIAGMAQVRVVHASRATPSVDFFVVATGATPTAGKSSLSAMVLLSTGTVALDPGTYDLYFTTTATVTSLAGPQPITVDAGGIYSVFLADKVGGGTPARIVLAD